MRSAPSFLFIAAFVACFCSAAVAAERHGARARLDLRIYIPHVLRLFLSGQPATIRVTAEDIERGEVVVRGARVGLVANGRNGFHLRAELTGETFTGVALEGLAAPIEVRERVAVLWMRSSAGGAYPGPAEVEYRFRLAPGTRPGQYAWPLALSLENA